MTVLRKKKPIRVLTRLIIKDEGGLELNSVLCLPSLTKVDFYIHDGLNVYTIIVKILYNTFSTMGEKLGKVIIHFHTGT
jgi:hypothetical protein